ncbi:AMP-binding protein [Nocardia brasiliensis]|uniref:AMP-binding protein n=1 Tax=Nocardia brasiliensis TaxID=37326 RepID=UPI0009DC9786|nr:AMP-binding protein [Nocardia brasiliensis]
MSYEQISERPSTLADILVRRGVEDPHRVGYTFLDADGHRETEDYGRLLDRVLGLATRLREISAPGDRVLLLCPSGLDMVHAYFACLLIRRVAVPLYVPTGQRHAETVAAIARDSGAVAVIAPQQAAAVARELLGWPDERILDSTVLDGGGARQLLDTPLPTENDVAHLQYTSGSTGSPKGVVVRHRNLLHNLECQRRAFGHTEHSSAVHWLPPSHDMGLVLGILSPLFAGYPATLMAPMTFLRKPLTWLRAVAEQANTTAGGPNLAFGICAERVSAAEAEELDLSRWDVAFVGAEPVNPIILRRFADKFAVSGFSPGEFLPGLWTGRGDFVCERRAGRFGSAHAFVRECGTGKGFRRRDAERARIGRSGPGRGRDGGGDRSGDVAAIGSRSGRRNLVGRGKRHHRLLEQNRGERAGLCGGNRGRSRYSVSAHRRSRFPGRRAPLCLRPPQRSDDHQRTESVPAGHRVEYRVHPSAIASRGLRRFVDRGER